MAHPDEAQGLLLRQGLQQRRQLAADDAEGKPHLLGGQEPQQGLRPGQLDHGRRPLAAAVIILRP